MPDASIGKRRLGPLQQIVLQDNIVPAAPCSASAADKNRCGRSAASAIARRATRSKSAGFQPSTPEASSPAYLLAIAVQQRLAHHDFTLAAVIRIGRVHVVHAIVDSVANHADRFVFKNIRADRVLHRGWAIACTQIPAPKLSSRVFQNCGIAGRPQLCLQTKYCSPQHFLCRTHIHHADAAIDDRQHLFRRILSAPLGYLSVPAR